MSWRENFKSSENWGFFAVAAAAMAGMAAVMAARSLAMGVPFLLMALGFAARALVGYLHR